MRLIDADKLWSHHICLEKGTAGYEAVNWEQIKNAPTIDAEPIRHGKWITYKDEHQCSVCGEIVCEEVYDQEGNWGSQGIYDFCPYCGAKMN